MVLRDSLVFIFISAHPVFSLSAFSVRCKNSGSGYSYRPPATLFQVRTSSPALVPSNPHGISAMCHRPIYAIASTIQGNTHTACAIRTGAVRGNTNMTRGEISRTTHLNQSRAHNNNQGSPFPSSPILQADNTHVSPASAHRRQFRYIQPHRNSFLVLSDTYLPH